MTALCAVCRRRRLTACVGQEGCQDLYGIRIRVSIMASLREGHQCACRVGPDLVVGRVPHQHDKKQQEPRQTDLHGVQGHRARVLHQVGGSHARIPLHLHVAGCEARNKALNSLREPLLMPLLTSEQRDKVSKGPGTVGSDLITVSDHRHRGPRKLDQLGRFDLGALFHGCCQCPTKVGECPRCWHPDRDRGVAEGRCQKLCHSLLGDLLCHSLRKGGQGSKPPAGSAPDRGFSVGRYRQRRSLQQSLPLALVEQQEHLPAEL
mmetsp:Transcript_3080/g.8746  ORF Transcript_3080/g.8746 Transcript_3080/m.8746 type:complete len:263 (-) Transcript_3080:1781-2569(-)